jgi:hypothetical protein
MLCRDSLAFLPQSHKADGGLRCQLREIVYFNSSKIINRLEPILFCNSFAFHNGIFYGRGCHSKPTGQIDEVHLKLSNIQQ